MNFKARLTELNRDEILKYLGYRGQEIDQNLNIQINRCIEKVKAASAPRLVWRRLLVHEGEVSEIELPGNDMKNLLSECDEAIFFAATLGPVVENLIMRRQVDNMADAVIMDSAASAAIENVCDNFEQEMRESLKAESLFLTDRFSPGYGDLPIEVQPDFCNLLNAEKIIGLTVSKTNIMIPRKSVTAIMGISKKEQTKSMRGCVSCNMFDHCEYRKSGKACGRELVSTVRGNIYGKEDYNTRWRNGNDASGSWS